MAVAEAVVPAELVLCPQQVRLRFGAFSVAEAQVQVEVQLVQAQPANGGSAGRGPVGVGIGEGRIEVFRVGVAVDDEDVRRLMTVQAPVCPPSGARVALPAG